MKRSLATPEPPGVIDAVRSVALVAGVVVLVLGLLIGVVYVAVFLDVVPLLR